MTFKDAVTSFSGMYVLFDKGSLKLTSGTGYSQSYNTTGSAGISQQNMGGKKSWTGTYKFTAKTKSSAAKISVTNVSVKLENSSTKMFKRAELEVAIQ